MGGTEFTPGAALLGGLLIGLAAVVLMWTTGRVAGASGIVARLLPPYSDGTLGSSVAFVAGLIAAPLLHASLTGTSIPWPQISAPLAAGAGLLVGLGSGLAGGCTSGHGICGLARFSKRSLAATATFMAVAVVTVFVSRHGLGG